ncbi:hypothetical protein JWV37_10320 [Sulfurospirillum sp. T05]|uniref:Replication-associated protein ORF2/G2P domain-containing protein n=1 Tax=Sulfurospirillum tamanense TaxID=2813362 RepID=A0ABS2WU43_9BACT|nr:hypothetical protein [Sulfurospirillum tamanensis]MBN2965176.1 hypothetical protein [Sulfurospirillum tamanensis]
MSKRPYGISKEDILIALEKIQNQRSYLENNVVLTGTGQFRSFADFSMSANLSKRYYAEVTNRSNTIHSLAMDCKHKPIFLTITLNGCWRDALRGDFGRFTAKDMQNIPTEVKYKINNQISLNIRDLVGVLNKLWDIFSNRAPFQGLRKRGEKINYIRAFEPHKKDGVPHIHALLYIPSASIFQALESFKNVFHAPQNLKNNQLSIEQKFNGEINGFQFTLTNPTGYVMKYIQKTFVNVAEGQDMDELTAWYIKHKVRRFLTSRSTIPLWVYRKIFFMEKDLFTLSQLRKEEESVCEWDIETGYIRLSFPQIEKEIIYHKGSYTYTVAGRILAHKALNETSCKIEPKPIMRQDKNKPLPDFVPVLLDDKPIGYTNGHGFTKELRKMPYQMTDLELIEHWQDLDFEDEKINPAYIANFHNELAKRNYADFEKVGLDYYAI